MGIEIERKFLFDPVKVPDMPEPAVIKQGYIPADGATVRVRIKNQKAFLTIKGKVKALVRSEFEYEVPFPDALEMLEELCPRPLIEKRRYEIVHEGHLWELDIFEGENTGLFLAEIELQSPEEIFARPPWVLEEVTHDNRYYNASLSRLPYSAFKLP